MLLRLLLCDMLLPRQILLTSCSSRSSGDKKTIDDLLEFLLRWFERFPEYRGRPFFVTGESYAGKLAPSAPLSVTTAACIPASCVSRRAHYPAAQQGSTC